MFTKSIFAILAAGLLVTNAFAAESEDLPRLQGLEQAIETKTTALKLSLPGSVPGSIALRPCEQYCAFVTLQITEASTFFLTRRAVTFAELRQFAQESDADVVVLFDPKSNVITRIIATDRTG